LKYFIFHVIIVKLSTSLASVHFTLNNQVMSEFERNYTQAEQHMHGSIAALVNMARELPSWGIVPVWRAHSMGNYLLLNAVDRVS
jgi:hypothetical protein